MYITYKCIIYKLHEKKKKYQRKRNKQVDILPIDVMHNRINQRVRDKSQKNVTEGKNRFVSSP